MMTADQWDLFRIKPSSERLFSHEVDSRFEKKIQGIFKLELYVFEVTFGHV
jgi:hypothetical protein